MQNDDICANIENGENWKVGPEEQYSDVFGPIFRPLFRKVGQL